MRWAIHPSGSYIEATINGDDYTLLDNSYNTQQSISFAGDPSQPAEMIASVTDRIATGSLATVPEPGSLTLLVVGTTGLLFRRRRRA